MWQLLIDEKMPTLVPLVFQGFELVLMDFAIAGICHG